MLATGNADKAREFLEQLTDYTGHELTATAIEFNKTVYGFLFATDTQHPSAVAPRLTTVPDVDETGTTLEANARIKAAGMCAATGFTAIADDTGLHVDALGGAPGVWSARFAGVNATYAENVEKLMSELVRAAALKPHERTARFETVIHVAAPDGAHETVVGAVEGTISDAARGAGTFGYDPVFVPDDGDGRTFAEMTPSEKHALSHRGRAFRNLLESCSIAVEIPDET